MKIIKEYAEELIGKLDCGTLKVSDKNYIKHIIKEMKWV